MDYLQAVVLAIMQGLTEFLPISSSAHLILVPVIFGWEDQGLAFDVAVHVGSLIAVVTYFRHEIGAMFRDWLLSLHQRKTVGDSRLAWSVLIATVPVGLAGLFLGEVIGAWFRSPVVIALATIGFGLLLWFADARGERCRDEHSLSWADVFYLGCCQVLALVPGTSRSGITITAGLMLGLTRTAAARFSFLMSIPVIVLAGGLQTLELLSENIPVDWGPIIVGTLLATVSAWLCIHFMLRLLDRIGMLPFVAYRMVLGVILLALFWA